MVPDGILYIISQSTNYSSLSPLPEVFFTGKYANDF